MKKKIISVLLCVLMIFTAFPIAVSAADGGVYDIKIIHTNDTHGYYKSTSYGTIGFEYLKALIDEKDADLVLDAGDTFHGQAFATIKQGKGIALLMSDVGYDAMTLGNHDWSYGADALKRLELVSGCSILASNVKKDGEDFLDKPYIVKEIKADNGAVIRVGVLGVIDDKFYTSTAPQNVAGLEFEEETRAATKTAELLREKENCDIVIALAHRADLEEFVGSIKGIDAVIAGHEHLVVNEKYKDASGKEIPVAEAGCNFSSVGMLTLSVNTATMEIEAASEAIFTSENTAALTPDSAISEEIAEIENRQSVELNKVIAHSNEAFPYVWEDVRVEEQKIGRVITAAYLSKTNADVAFENAGGIRAGIPEGDITYGNLISISPYGNTLLTKELTGRQILDIAEHSLEINYQCNIIYELQKQAIEKGEDPYQYAWPDDSGSALQFGGLKVQYDMSKKEGERIITAKIGGEDVQPDKLYTVATNSYAAVGFDYPALASAPLCREYGTCEEAIKKFIAENDFELSANEANFTPYVFNENSENNQADGAKPNEGAKPAPSPRIPNTGAEASQQSAAIFSCAMLGVLILLNKKKMHKMPIENHNVL